MKWKDADGINPITGERFSGKYDLNTMTYIGGDWPIKDYNLHMEACKKGEIPFDDFLRAMKIMDENWNLGMSPEYVSQWYSDHQENKFPVDCRDEFLDTYDLIKIPENLSVKHLDDMSEMNEEAAALDLTQPITITEDNQADVAAGLISVIKSGRQYDLYPELLTARTQLVEEIKGKTLTAKELARIAYPIFRPILASQPRDFHAGVIMRYHFSGLDTLMYRLNYGKIPNVPKSSTSRLFREMCMAELEQLKDNDANLYYE